MSKGEGFGKVILFGEHFVVYYLPGIASGISGQTIATLEDGQKGFELVDNRPQVPGYGEKKSEEMKRQFEAIFNYFKINPEETPIKITLAGDLLCSSGVGASAALAASTARAFNEKLNLNLNDEEINKVAYLAEEAGSGTPSGIDNTCSVFGGFITFEKNKEGGPNKIEKLSVSKPVEIVMVSTGITQETKVVVADVLKLKESDEEQFKAITDEYIEVYNSAVKAINSGDWKRVGELMDKNHELLQKIGVSCDELEHLVKVAKDNGAWGAKLTGTGRGGYMIALTPGKELQEKVAKAFEDEGFTTLRTSVG
ncbi:MAG: mevalonate kinase [Candidatus Aenigmarchaeota archaeon]|nr:mevalonate kinase [Candidatus Aenigmarchaeota archaeon]